MPSHKPATVRTVQILFFVVFGVVLLRGAVGFLLSDLSAYQLGRNLAGVIFASLPLLVGILLGSGRKTVFWLAIVSAAGLGLGGLSRLGGGEPVGLLYGVTALTCFVLLLARNTRLFFFPRPAPGGYPVPQYAQQPPYPGHPAGCAVPNPPPPPWSGYEGGGQSGGGTVRVASSPRRAGPALAPCLTLIS